MRRLRNLFSWSAAGPVLAYLASILIVISVVGAFVAAHDATDARNKTAAAAARRVDNLLHRIDTLQAQLRNTSTRDAQERGRLEDAIRALAAQIRQAGGTPVTTGEPERSRQSRPSSRPSRSPRPSPQPSRSPQPSSSPTPSPSPSHCIAIPLHKPVCI